MKVKRTTNLAKMQQLAIQGYRDGRFTREVVRKMLISSGMTASEVKRNMATFAEWS